MSGLRADAPSYTPPSNHSPLMRPFIIPPSQAIVFGVPGGKRARKEEEERRRDQKKEKEGERKRKEEEHRNKEEERRKEKEKEKERGKKEGASRSYLQAAAPPALLPPPSPLSPTPPPISTPTRGVLHLPTPLAPTPSPALDHKAALKLARKLRPTVADVVQAASSPPPPSPPSRPQAPTLPPEVRPIKGLRLAELRPPKPLSPLKREVLEAREGQYREQEGANWDLLLLSTQADQERQDRLRALSLPVRPLGPRQAADLALRQVPPVVVKPSLAPFLEAHALVTHDLDLALEAALGVLATLQRRVRAHEPAKAKTKRRLVVGLAQARKWLEAHKARALVLATNPDPEPALEEALTELRDLAEREGVPVLVASTQRRLGRALGLGGKATACALRLTEGVDWGAVLRLGERNLLLGRLQRLALAREEGGDEGSLGAERAEVELALVELAQRQLPLLKRPPLTRPPLSLLVRAPEHAQHVVVEVVEGLGGCTLALLKSKIEEAWRPYQPRPAHRQRIIFRGQELLAPEMLLAEVPRLGPWSTLTLLRR